MFKIVFTKQAKKDYQKIIKSPLKEKALRLLSVLKTDPMQPPFEKLVDMNGVYSRRINIQHRLVYKVYESEQVVAIISLWTQYEMIGRKNKF